MTVVAWGPRAGAPPLVIAHRGASAHAPENTLAAFRRAEADGADAIELDVLPCASGEPVVFHDEDLERLAGRPGRVAELTRAELAKVRLAGGEPIPLLAEVLDACPLLVNVEIKAPRALEPRIVRFLPALARLLRGHRAAPRLLVSSFNPLVLAELRLLAPRLPTALLFGRAQALPLRLGWARFPLRTAAVHPEHGLVTARRLGRWRSEGRAVNVWTVDDAGEVGRLEALGVDGLITNDPARTRGYLARS